MPTTGTGGGILNRSFPFDSPLSLHNTTVTANRADFRGAGISVEHGTSATLRNTIVVDNTNTFGNRFGAIDCFRDFQVTITSEGNNLTGFPCDYVQGVGDLTTFESRLGPLQNNGGLTLTHALLVFRPRSHVNDRAGRPSR